MFIFSFRATEVMKLRFSKFQHSGGGLEFRMSFGQFWRSRENAHSSQTEQVSERGLAQIEREQFSLSNG